MPNPTPYLITAIGTPLTDNDELHRQGLAAHLDDQSNHGIDAVLVGGSMGYMQMLRDETYHELIRHSVDHWASRGELLVGVGDASLGRTLDRIKLVNEHKVDGVVALTPAMWPLKPQELLDHYRALADASRAPVFLYDLPVLTGVAISQELALQILEHPNIGGIKCSGAYDLGRTLLDRQPEGKRVVVAQPLMIDTLVRDGVKEHLDGVFGLAPMWVRQIADDAHAGRYEQARAGQKRVNALLHLLRQNVAGNFTALLNARGIPGRYAPRPLRMLDDAAREQFLDNQLVQQVLTDHAETTPPLAAVNGQS